MKTVKQLGALMKREHRGKYDGYSDEEVGRATKLQYPGKYDDFLEINSSVNSSMETYTPNPLVKEVAQLVEYYDPKKGRFSSWWQSGKSEARTKLQTVLSNEQMIVLKQAADYEKEVLAGKMRIVEYNSFIAQNQFELGALKANAILISQALEEGYTSENWQFEKFRRAEHGREQSTRDAEHKFQLELLEKEITLKLSQAALELDIFKQKEAIKLNNQIEEWRQQVRFSLIGESMSSLEKKMMIQEKLDEMYQQIEQIEKSNYAPMTKKRMIEGREDIISQFIKFRDSL